MAQYVCSGAMIKCSMGLSPSSLVVLPVNRTMNNNKPQANIMDHKPMVNILPFGLCRSLANPTVASATAAAWGTLTPMPCMPNTPAPWMPGNPKMLVANKPALTKPSKLVCAYAGTISFVNPGQFTVKDGALFSFSSFGKYANFSAQAKTNKAYAKANAGISRQGDSILGSFDAAVGYSAFEAKGDFALGKNNPLISGDANVSALNAEAKASGHVYIKNNQLTALGFGAKAAANVAQGRGTIGIGGKNNPLAAVSGEFEALSAKAWADGFIGSDDEKAGFSFSAGAKAHVLEGAIEKTINIPIPFTKWSFQFKTKASGTVLGKGAEIGGKAFYDKKTKRFHAGVAGSVALALGLGADIEFSIGKRYE